MSAGEPGMTLTLRNDEMTTLASSNTPEHSSTSSYHHHHAQNVHQSYHHHHVQPSYPHHAQPSYHDDEGYHPYCLKLKLLQLLRTLLRTLQCKPPAE